jgi:hypothetical protein
MASSDVIVTEDLPLTMGSRLMRLGPLSATAVYHEDADAQPDSFLLFDLFSQITNNTVGPL